MFIRIPATSKTCKHNKTDISDPPIPFQRNKTNRDRRYLGTLCITSRYLMLVNALTIHLLPCLFKLNAIVSNVSAVILTDITLYFNNALIG